MSSITSSTGFIATQFFQNLEKYNDDRVKIIESGASGHMTSKKSNLFSDERFDWTHKVILGDNSETYAKGKE